MTQGYPQKQQCDLGNAEKSLFYVFHKLCWDFGCLLGLIEL